MAAELPGRLLLDLPNWVGDQLMALPAVHRLVAANHGGTTVLHTRPATRRLVARAVPEATVLATARRASPFRVALNLCRDRGRFDLGVTLRNAARAKIFLRLSSRRAWGSRGQGSSLLLDWDFPVDRGLHQIHDADALLRRLDLPAVGEDGYGLRLGAETLQEGRRLLAGIALGNGTRVGLAPASALGSVKRWPNEHFGELARLLRRHGMAPVVVVGPGEEHFGAAISTAAGWQVPMIGADLDVAGLAAVLGQLQVLVSVDSGPMHLAAAMGTPVLALFGPTEAHRTRPLGRAQRVLSHPLECLGCARPRCPLGHRRCMVELAPQRVADELLAMCEQLAQGLSPAIPNGAGRCG